MHGSSHDANVAASRRDCLCASMNNRWCVTSFIANESRQLVFVPEYHYKTQGEASEKGKMFIFLVGRDEETARQLQRGHGRKGYLCFDRQVEGV